MFDAAVVMEQHAAGALYHGFQLRDLVGPSAHVKHLRAAKAEVSGRLRNGPLPEEAAEELKLNKGQPASAVIKASDVMVSID